MAGGFSLTPFSRTSSTTPITCCRGPDLNSPIRLPTAADGVPHISRARLAEIRATGSEPVALISANLAREMWGTPSAAVGKRIGELRSGPRQQVIGVVEDVRENGVNEKPPAIVYWPAFAPNTFGPGFNVRRAATFAVRSDRAGTEG